MCNRIKAVRNRVYLKAVADDNISVVINAETPEIYQKFHSGKCTSLDLIQSPYLF